jgi:hypothetical protein
MRLAHDSKQIFVWGCGIVEYATREQAQTPYRRSVIMLAGGIF